MASNRRKREKREIRYSDAKKTAASRDSGTGRTAYNVPEGMEVLKIDKPGIYKFDILPFESKPGNPQHDPEFPYHWERTFYTHGGVGAENKTYCCLARTFKKRCPICDDAMRLRRSGDEDDAAAAKDIRSSQRQLFVIRDRNDDDKIKLFEMSHFCFGAMLDEKIKSSDEEDEYHYFHRLDKGMTLKVTFKEEKKKFKFMTAANIEMRPRQEPIDDSILDEVPCLDDLLIEMPYDRLKAVYEMRQEDAADKDADTPAPKAARAANKKKDDGDEAPAAKGHPADEAGISVGGVVEYEGGECEVLAVSADGETLRLKDEDGKIHKSVKVADVEPVETDSETEEEEDDDGPVEPAQRKKPGPKPKAKPGPKAKPPVEEEDDDDEDDDEGDDGDSDDDDDDSDDDDEPWEDDDEDDEEDDEDDGPPQRRGRPKKR